MPEGLACCCLYLVCLGKVSSIICSHLALEKETACPFPRSHEPERKSFTRGTWTRPWRRTTSSTGGGAGRRLRQPAAGHRRSLCGVQRFPDVSQSGATYLLQMDCKAHERDQRVAECKVQSMSICFRLYHGVYIYIYYDIDLDGMCFNTARGSQGQLPKSPGQAIDSDVPIGLPLEAPARHLRRVLARGGRFGFSFFLRVSIPRFGG